ncbi:MAG: multiheme C-type cytochrome [Deferribacteraceae bacterium]|nr:multiheme C-type cytochrome [Deferribacteraceae bacterium]
MKKVLVALFVLSFALVVFAVDKGPETIDLSKAFNVEKTTKKPVMFPHAFHQSKNDCTECHMSPEGGKDLKNINNGGKLEVGQIKGINHNIHKEFCFPCHVAKNVPKGKVCSTCHK